MVWRWAVRSAMSTSASYQPLGISILPYPLTDAPTMASEEGGRIAQMHCLLLVLLGEKH